VTLPASGFDQRPSRPLVLTLVLFAGVVVGAAVFAHVFRATTLAALRWIADEPSATAAARSLHPVVLFVLVAGTVGLAAIVGLSVDTRLRQHVGVEAVAASARGEARSISLRASLIRAAATWILSVGGASVGRESAIIETGGAAGAVMGRRTGGRGDVLAVAGIAAAFAAAYHAPLAAILYVEEHLGVRRSRRAVAFALTAAAGGHGATLWLFDVEPIFPGTTGSRWTMIAVALLVLVPALLAARTFRQLRVRLSGRAIADRFGVHRVLVVGVLGTVAGLAVAVFPDAAGNGMEALRAASGNATLTVALGLAVGKLIGTTATLAAGAPGGVVTPTMAITAGIGLLAVLGLREVGLVVEHPWDVMVACMAIGVAVGMRSPLVAIVLVPEMLGDYLLIPAVACVVAAAVVVDLGLDALLDRVGETRLVPRSAVFDEDG
jgi:CIC family chloride channel protein